MSTPPRTRTGVREDNHDMRQMLCWCDHPDDVHKRTGAQDWCCSEEDCHCVSFAEQLVIQPG